MQSYDARNKHECIALLVWESMAVYIGLLYGIKWVKHTQYNTES